VGSRETKIIVQENNIKNKPNTVEKTNFNHKEVTK